MQPRFLKQLIYGSMYLALWFGVGYLVYTFAFKPAPTCFDGKQNGAETGVDCGGSCEPCDLKTLKPIQVMPVGIFDSGDGRISALLELRNPNTKYGADSFVYRLVFSEASGDEVWSAARESFIYPGEIKFIVEAGLSVGIQSVLRGDVELSDFSWKPIKEFASPETGVRDVRVEYGEDKRVSVSGLLVNENPFTLREAVINVIVSDERGVRAGVSKTLLEGVLPGEEKSFVVAVPNVDAQAVGVNSVKIIVEAKK